MQRHFPYKHPTFGSKDRPKPESAWTSSVYYWWWEYLRRNTDYLRTCEQGGKGKCAKLYVDFGDVRTSDFREWWLHGGRAVHCFAEPATPTIQELRDGNVADIQNTECLVLSVPLNLPITHLRQEFTKVLQRHHKNKNKRGVRANLSSKARYTVQGKVDRKFLENALKVWDARQTEPKKSWWRIALDSKIIRDDDLVRELDSTGVDTMMKNVLAATASRLYRKADAIINNTAKGLFPVSTVGVKP
jgi:hypothetical protein